MITKTGLDIVGKASAAMDGITHERYGGLTAAEFDQLSNLLDRMRG